MATLREMLTTNWRERADAGVKATLDEHVDSFVEMVVAWLEQDHVRGIVYDGIVDYGPTTRNVVKHLAEEARK